jgi:enoyl-[acyl-carrier protein] reductase/trans-2-enoyl-CoA reductase (NAD+)
MRERGTHEGCIEQMNRLFRDRLYAGTIPVDEAGRIRLDELELDPAVQARVQELWEQATTENLAEIADFANYRTELSRICGFESPGVDYAADVNQHVAIPSL